jgi:hypothetical protein
MPLDITLFREEGGNPESIRESQRRRYASVQLVDEIIAQDAEWRQMTGSIDNLRKARNALQKEVGKKMKAKEACDELVAQIKSIGEDITKAEADQKELKTVIDKKVRLCLCVHRFTCYCFLSIRCFELCALWCCFLCYVSVLLYTSLYAPINLLHLRRSTFVLPITLLCAICYVYNRSPTSPFKVGSIGNLVDLSVPGRCPKYIKYFFFLSFYHDLDQIWSFHLKHPQTFFVLKLYSQWFF